MYFQYGDLYMWLQSNDSYIYMKNVCMGKDCTFVLIIGYSSRPARLLK